MGPQTTQHCITYSLCNRKSQYRMSYTIPSLKSHDAIVAPSHNRTSQVHLLFTGLKSTKRLSRHRAIANRKSQVFHPYVIPPMPMVRCDPIVIATSHNHNFYSVVFYVFKCGPNVLCFMFNVLYCARHI